MTKDVIGIDFYKRRSTSISDIDHLSIKKSGENYLVLLNDRKRKTMTEQEFKDMVHHLLVDFKDAYQEEYLAFDYELEKTNYPLKFYLRISFEGSTYLGLKGIRPFQQIHYHDIVDFFRPWMSE